VSVTNKSLSPLVSIVIVNWNGLEDTKLCLKHTRQQTYKNTEIIIVDNGSEDNSVNYLKRQNDITLVQNPKNLGFTGGHIAGYQASQGDFVLLLNNDAIMDRSYIENALKSMQDDKEIAAIGGRAYMWDENNDLFDHTNDFYAYQNINPITAEGIFTKHDNDVRQKVNVVSGSCVLIRKSITEELGYLHKPFFAYFEESDLFARMKRAGYKIIYDPELAIWHANAKSTNKKPPTFFYYMLMRNRFRFAVRNFDNWSLRRFLKFYIKMGIISILKTFLPHSQRSISQANAKAFLYNLIFGWKAFMERRELNKTLGRSDYNEQIVREQNGISIVIPHSLSAKVTDYIKLASRLEPFDELILVTDDSALAQRVNRINNTNHSIRVCADKELLNTHQANIGAICAKNEWLMFGGRFDTESANIAFEMFERNLYILIRTSKKLAFRSSSNGNFKTMRDVLYGECSQEILVSKDLFIDEGGFSATMSIENAKRQLLAYSQITNCLLPIPVDRISKPLPLFSNEIAISELKKQLKGRERQAALDRKPPSALDKFTARYYRAAQLRNLVSWVFYPRIPMRLKVGRTKNLIFGAVTINRLSIATELKHMRNEVMIYKNSLDVVALKHKELERLRYLKEKPSETPILIVIRDRYEHLKKLLAWLDKQGLHRIILIDNDSKLPPLMDYLEKTPFQVLELGRNMKHTAPWSAGIVKVLLPDDFYVVTDPDIIPVMTSGDVLPHLYDIHSKYPYHIKVGLGLKIDDLPDTYPLKQPVIEWERQFWKVELEPQVYEAGVDTTFALYKPHTYKYTLHPSIRIGEPYTARHLPWYSDGKKLSDEDIFYRLRADQEVNSWDKDHLPERYKNELARQRH
jgi:GT2 family glycosyltransferase